MHERHRADVENPLLVYTSNVIAIRGLRSMYLVRADVLSSPALSPTGAATRLVFSAVKVVTD
jgi:predicted tellurium resistance membrane protein TerC